MRVLRDGTAIATLPVNTVRYADSPSAGAYLYSVHALDLCGASPSASDIGQKLSSLPPIQNVQATDDRSDSIIVTWTNPAGEDSFRILRDGTAIATRPANTIRYADSPPVGAYLYTVLALNVCGASPADTAASDSGHCLVSTTDKMGPVPTEFFMAQNFSNPFNPTTTFKFGVPRTSHVSIRAYDILGRQVDTLVDGIIQPWPSPSSLELPGVQQRCICSCHVRRWI